MPVATTSWPLHVFDSRLIHGGQLLNGLAGPTVMNAAPFLSTTWFSADERATATAIASMLSYLGGACAFLVGPLVVPAPNGTAPLLASENSRAHIKDRIETVLYAGILRFIFLPIYFLLSPSSSLCFLYTRSLLMIQRTNTCICMYVFSFHIIWRCLFKIYPF